MIKKKINLFRKELTKHKADCLFSRRYDKYFVIDGKKMGIENFDMSALELRKVLFRVKRIFVNQWRIDWFQSCLNKFIRELHNHVLALW